MAEYTNPYSGGFKPVREEVTAHDLPVTGRIPAELNGRYLRNGPNPMNLDDPTLHLFLGEGMVHGVRLREGRAEWYRNRWVRSEHVASELGERHPGGASVNLGDAACNTHVIGHAGRTLALVESGPRPYELTYELDTARRGDFGGTLPGGYTAHPKLDPRTGELHAVCYQFGDDQVRYLVVSPEGRVTSSIGVPAAHQPMIHDCALTERYVVLYDLPVTFSEELARGGAQLPYAWNERRPARIGLLPRAGTGAGVREGAAEGTGVPQWFEVEPCWIFHTLNAYDEGDAVVIDAVRYDHMMRDARLEGSPLPTLDRWTLDTATGKTTQSRLDDRPQEFPTVSPAAVAGAHRYGYAAVTPDINTHLTEQQELSSLPDDAFGDALLKHDLTAGSAQRRPFRSGAYAGEPFFVPSATAAAEDDGYVMSFVHDPDRGATDLLILSAQDFTGDPVAAVHLPVRVPLGFHGSWVPDAA
ncbi:carotenoid oxygenase family protein [Streptomyces sp. ODS28]|uniref:carotenoid oxygenase family protein n=1 Tax=Streptomyces sp. ODS28 TaxID=3136688 RepID=UPI0031EF1290